MASDGCWEDFGQKVDLTARIREILVNYPEGTSILKELLQNADDAGARVAKFCLDLRHHPTSSLVHPNLCGFQGPALYAFNDATFNESDFESISNIGDSGKAKDAKKTGRFGVGFNSCYHMTDLPSFVSGDHVVFFDPHCKYLPNVSAANPGKKLNFVRSDISAEHADQFSPFRAFGCDMEHQFAGTLFRFPLRTPEQAASSKISKQVYDTGSVEALFEALREEAPAMLLFLKNVEAVETYIWHEGHVQPQKLHGTSVRNPQSGHLRKERSLFLDVVARGGPNGEPTFGLHELNLVRWQQGDSPGGTFLVAQECGSGAAAAMARDAAIFFNTPLIPWVGIAAPISGDQNPEELQALSRAFCFLPLPVATGLPVHVNGFFELSTNRRDIWYGEDLTGSSKMRSDWNVCLIREVLPGCYLRVLQEAAKRLGPGPSFFRLWPSDTVSEPWRSCVLALYASLAGAELVWVKTAPKGQTSGGPAGRWVRPAEAVYPEGQLTEDLEQALVAIGLPVASAPDRLLDCLRRLTLRQHKGVKTTSPELVRSWLQAHPASWPGGELGPVLLHFCLSDVNLRRQPSVKRLVSLSCLPLAGGGLGQLGVPPSPPVFVVSATARELLAGLAAAPGREVLDSLALDSVPGLLQTLEALADTQWLNLSKLGPQDLADRFLPALLPAGWARQRVVQWDPRPEGGLSAKRLRLLWEVLAAFSTLRPLEASQFPLVPTAGGCLHALVSVQAGTTLLQCPAGGWGQPLSEILQALGCHLVEATCQAMKHQEISSRYSHPPTVQGILDALASACSGKVTLLEETIRGGALSADQKHTLRRALLTSSAWLGVVRPSRNTLNLLKALPIYCSAKRRLVTVENGELEMNDDPVFLSLLGERFLPPEHVSRELLTDEFVWPEDQGEAEVMSRLLGMQRLPRPAFFRRCIVDRVEELPLPLRDAALMQMLTELPQLQHEDRDIVMHLRSVPFVPTLSGRLAAPCQLYDPRVADLMNILDLKACFPLDPFDCEVALSALLQIGLRSRVDPDTVLEAARLVESLKGSQPREAADRGRTLLSYMDNGWKRMHNASRQPGNQLGKMFSRVFKSDSAWDNLEQFWADLSMIAWCPVMTESPSEGLPWPPSHGESVAPPRLCRPPADAWLASASLRLVDQEVYTQSLRDDLGWSARLGGSILAQQLQELGDMHKHVKETSLSQALASAVPALYSALSSLDATQLEVACELLGDAPCVWVGNGFQRPSKVAFSGPLNLAPWLYVIPMDLAPFKSLLVALGVCTEFTSRQYVTLLEEMATESAGKPMSAGQLAQVVSVIQGLADRVRTAPRAIYVPDTAGVLRPASELAFNDAPWLGGRPDLTFVHTRISHEVAQAMGVVSLRRMLLAQSADSMDLTMHSMEAFGQSEALTTRLRHIVEAYADGPGILMELVQNADDAGATSTGFMLDLDSYAADSVLAPRMAPWQGPALLAFNDAVFSPADFQAISRIGQDSKLQRPTATGRFGLGFNAVYHLTDMPSFVSGDYIVMFDPHAKYLPGITPAQPGLKIGFQKANLLAQFPDAFQPFLQFGCTLKDYFKGTLFRFPLRPEEVTSDITSEPYPPEKVSSLLRTFQHEAAKALLFLKSVREVTVHVKQEGKVGLLYTASLTPEEGRPSPQRPVAEFVRGGPGGAETTDGKVKEFHQRLATCKEEDLPRSSEVVSLELAVPGQQHQVERWLICNGLGGGEARKTAVRQASQRGGARLVPWAGCAARLQGPPPVEGQAFCFLPLPLHTGLPVHVNGYFELSSNRRDIWHGEDMVGVGKLRAQWNMELIRDAVAPLYAHVLSQAASVLGPTAEFYALWPTHQPLGPWGRAVGWLYRLLARLPVLWVEGGNGTNGRWVEPEAACLVDPSVPLPPQVLDALLADGMPIPRNLPATASGLLLKHSKALATVTPATVCHHFASPDLPHPVLQPGDGLVALTTSTPEGEEAQQGDHQQPQPQLRTASALLEYCLSGVRDTSEDSLSLLLHLPLLPLQDGSLGTLKYKNPAHVLQKLFSSSAVPSYLLVTELESSLLHGTALTGRSVAIEVLSSDVISKLQMFSAGSLGINVTNLGPKEVAESVLPALLPSAWKGRESVPWDPQQDDAAAASHVEDEGPPVPTLQRMQLLWDRLQLEGDLDMTLHWPVLPLTSSRVRSLRGRSAIIFHGGWTEQMSTALNKCGCDLVDTRVHIQHSALKDIAYSGDCAGVLAALPKQVDGDLEALTSLFTRFALTSEERNHLRNYLLQAQWFQGASALGSWERKVLGSLPIFVSAWPPGQSGAAPSAESFVSLTSAQRYLAPEGAGPELLDASFLRPGGAAEEQLLKRELGVQSLTWSAFYRTHLLSRLDGHDSAVQTSVALQIFGQLTSLAQEDPAFVTALRTTAIVPTSEGTLRSPSGLFDPENPQLRALLDLESCFPSTAVRDSPGALAALAKLGMQTKLGAAALRRSAEVISLSADTQVGLARSKALLTELEKLADGQEVDGVTEADGFWEAMQSVEWCPVLAKPPHEGLPWPETITLLASPRVSRPLASAWQVSASMRILAVETSAALAFRMGWGQTPPGSVLAAQLLELGRKYPRGEVVDPELQAILEQAAKGLYSMLSGYLGQPEEDLMVMMLEASNSIWVGNGFSCSIECALQPDSSYEPFLYTVPEWLVVQHQQLLNILCVPKTFGSGHFWTALQRAAEDTEGALLTSDQTKVAVAMVETAVELDLHQAEAPADVQQRTKATPPVERVFVPDSDGLLATPEELYYNDATWLSEGQELRMIHPDISQAAAEHLGVRSLRYFHQVQQSQTQQLPCPPAALLQKVLDKQADPEVYALFDIMEVADACGCQSVDIWVDNRQHGTQSVLHSGLSAFQGASLCVALPGVKLTAEELCQLQSPSSPFRFRGETCHYGCGLLSSYLLTDLPMALSGDCLYMWDPAGRNLSKGDAPVAKQYHFTNSDLTVRFADQFSAWGFTGADVTSGYSGTLLKLPLRTQQQAEKSPVRKVEVTGEALEAVLRRFSSFIGQSMLFLTHLRRVRVQKWQPGATAAVPVHQVKVVCTQSSGDKHDKEDRGFGRGLGAGLAKMVSHLAAGGRPKVRTMDVDLYTEDFGHASGSPALEQTSWVVATFSSPPTSKDPAIQRKFSSLQLNPLGAVAFCVSLHSSPHVTPRGGLFGPLPIVFDANPAPASPLSITTPDQDVTGGEVTLAQETHGLAALPFLVCANFALARSGGRNLFSMGRVQEFEDDQRGSCSGAEAAAGMHPDVVRACFNQEMMRSVGGAWLEAFGRLQQQLPPESIPELYHLLPLQTGHDASADLQNFCRAFYRVAAERPMWRLHSGRLVRISEGYFLQPLNNVQELGPSARDWIMKQLPLFDVPRPVKAELEAAGVKGSTDLTPSGVRQMMKSVLKSNGIQAQLTPEQATELLRFCMADIRLTSAAGQDAGPLASSGDASNGTVRSSRADGTGEPQPQGNTGEGLLAALETTLSGSGRDIQWQALMDTASREFSAIASSVRDAIATDVRPMPGDPLAAAPPPEVNREALRECIGLPMPAASGRTILLGTKQLLVWAPGLRVQPIAVANQHAALEAFVHPLAVEALGVVLQMKQVQHALRLCTFTLDHLAGLMPAFLPPVWAPGAAYSQPIVAWEDGAAGGPSANWLEQMWTLALDLAASEGTPPYEALDMWPLLPLHDGGLMRVRHHAMVLPAIPIIPAEAQKNTDKEGEWEAFQEEQAPPAGHGDEVWGADPWLLALLARLGCPCLDPRFESLNIIEPLKGSSAQEIFLQILQRVRLASEAGHFSASGLSTEESEKLYGMLCAMVPSGLDEANVRFLRSLPIFRMHQSERPPQPLLPVEHRFVSCPSDVCSAVAGPGMQLPPSVTSSWVAHSEASHGALVALGVVVLSAADLLRQYLLPGYPALPSATRAAVLHYIKTNWSTHQGDETLLEAIRDAEFVEASGGAERLLRASQLLDPTNELLAKVFQDRPDLFPAKEFCCREWLQVLRAAGLRSEMDAPLFQECAAEMESRGMASINHIKSGPDSEKTWEAAMTLTQFLVNHPTLLRTSGFAKTIGAVAFVPARQGTPGAPPRGTQGRCLTSYSKAAIRKDWALVWTRLPIVEENCLPSTSFWGSLGLRSPPLLDCITDHLHTIGSDAGHSCLSSWPPEAGSIEKVFSSVLQYLDEQGDFTRAQADRLSAAAFIPVGNNTRLSRPSGLFRRLRVNLAPFAFEVPTRYITHTKVLEQLGARDEPSAADLLELMTSASASMAGRVLNANERNAFLRLLGAIVQSTPPGGQEERKVRTSAQRGELRLPDCSGRLIPSNTCMSCQKSMRTARLLGRIDPSKVCLVHPMVPPKLCALLGVPQLEAMTVEQLDRSRPLQQLQAIQGVSVESVRQLLSSMEFAEAVAELCSSLPPVAQAMESELCGRQAGASKRLSQGIFYRLQSCFVSFVEMCSTRVVLKGSNTDITQNGGLEPVNVFVDALNNALYIANPLDGILVAPLLSQGVSSLLGSPFPLPLDSLFNTAGAGLTTFQASLLPARGGAMARFEAAQAVGALGRPLSQADSRLIELRPLRPYFADELVAYKDDSARQGAAVLRYGCVVSDCRPEPGQGLYRVLVEIEPGRHQDILSTQVYSFRDSSLASEDDAALSQDGAEPGAVTSPQLQSAVAAAAIESAGAEAALGCSRDRGRERPSSSTISSKALVGAVEEMLGAAGMPLDLDRSVLLQTSLELKQELASMKASLVCAEEAAGKAQATVERATSAWQCRICLTNSVDTAFVGCGHLLCNGCCTSVGNRCPFCRKVSQPVRVYK